VPELRNRVKETSVTTGTGDVTLAGPPTGFVSFNAALGIGTATYYVIEHQTLNEWEIGQGVLSDATTLVRSSVLGSSNSNLAVNFSAGNKTVFIDVPASQFVTRAAANLFAADNTFQSNLLLGAGSPAVGTSGVGVLALGNSTSPTTQPADGVQLYAADYAAGDSRLQVWSESGTSLWIGNGTIAAKAPASGAGNSLTLSASAAVDGNTNGGDTIVQLAAKSGSGADGKFIVKSAGAANNTNLVEFRDNNNNVGVSVRTYSALNTLYMNVQAGLNVFSGYTFGSGSSGMWCESTTGDLVLSTISGAVRPEGDNVNGVTLGKSTKRFKGLYLSGTSSVQLASDVIGQKIVLYSAQTADAFQVLASDGVTIGYGLDANYRTYFTPQTAPTAATDKVYVSSADYTTADARLLITSESGNAIWIGNSRIEAKAPASGGGASIVIKGSNAISGTSNGGDTVVQLTSKSGAGNDGKFVVKAATSSPGGNQLEFQNSSGTAFWWVDSSNNSTIDNAAFRVYNSTGPYSAYHGWNAFSDNGLGGCTLMSRTDGSGGLMLSYRYLRIGDYNGYSSLYKFTDSGGLDFRVFSSSTYTATITTAARGQQSGTDPRQQLALLIGPGVARTSNTAGENLTLWGGQGKGTGVGGSVFIQVAQGGASGSTANTLNTIATFSPTTQHFKITNQADVIGQKIVLYSTQTADAFQVLASDGVTKYACIDSAGNFSRANGTNSEQFGSGATASGGASTAIGKNALSSVSGGTALGYDARTVSGNYATSLGSSSRAAGTNSLAIGESASSAANYSIAIGCSATTTAVNQLVIGGASCFINDVYIGYGVTAGSPTAVSINANGGSGTDIAGGAINIAGGKGTGAGTPGVVNIQTSTAGVSGTTLQSLTTRLTVDGTGQVGIPSVVSGSQLSVTCSSASTVGLTVTGDVSQTANLQTWKKGSTTVANVSPTGVLTLTGSGTASGLSSLLATTSTYLVMRGNGQTSSGAYVSIGRDFTEICSTNIGGTNQSTTLTTTAAGTVVCKLQLAAAHTADALQVTQNDGTTVLTNVTKDGYAYSRKSDGTQYVGLMSQTALSGSYPGIHAYHNSTSKYWGYNGASDKWITDATCIDLPAYGGILGYGGNQLTLYSNMPSNPAIVINNTQGGPSTSTGYAFFGQTGSIDVNLHAGYMNHMTLCSGGTYSTGQTAGNLYLLSGGNFSSHAGNSQPGNIYIGSGPASGTGTNGNVHLGHNGSAALGNVCLYTLVSPFVTPSALTADVNDYAPPRGKNYRLSTDGGNYSLTGLDIAQVDGQEVTLINIGSGTITLSDEDTGSTAANRFHCVSGASIVLDTDERADLIYDATSARWRVF